MLVDTDVWSEAFRKKPDPKSEHVQELKSLIEQNRVQLVGTIRMEILCGLKETKQFDRIASRLAAFPDRTLDSEIFILAARFFNACRRKGIQGSNNDFILCACSVAWKMPILSKDKDYLHFKKYLPIELLSPGKQTS